MPNAVPYLASTAIGAVGTWAGNKLSGGGGGNGNGGGGDPNLQATNMWDLGPETKARQMHLWNQAEQYAATDPFQSQYGGAAAMPGMGAMSQLGQQYLTNQILGPGAYLSLIHI